MKKKRNLLVFVSSSIVFLILLAIHVENVHQRKLLEVQIGHALNEYLTHDKSYIDFENINIFTWDKVYAFGPYSNCKNIVDTLGTKFFWIECKFSGIEQYEGYTLFVFMNQQSIIQYVMYFGVEVSSNTRNGIPQGEAHFNIDDEGRMTWLDKP